MSRTKSLFSSFLQYLDLFLNLYTSFYSCEKFMAFRTHSVCLFGLPLPIASLVPSFLCTQQCLFFPRSPLLVSFCQFWPARKMQFHNFHIYSSKLMEVFLQADMSKLGSTRLLLRIPCMSLWHSFFSITQQWYLLDMFQENRGKQKVVHNGNIITWHTAQKRFAMMAGVEHDFSFMYLETIFSNANVTYQVQK